MNGNFVLSELRGNLEEAGVQHRGIFFPRRLHLHAMIASTGYSMETGHYDWHGLKRGAGSEFCLIQHTLSGEGRLRWENLTRPVSAGETMILHCPHDNRYWRPQESDHWRFIYLIIQGRYVIEMTRQIIAHAGPLVTLSPDRKALPCIFSTVLETFNDTLGSAFQVSARAYELMMLLADELLPQGLVSSEERPAPILQAMRYCRRNYGQPIGVEDLARASGYNRHHFSRLFSDVEGISPSDYLRNTRMKAAARLLQETDLPIAAIGSQVGFPDPAYFCKVFRRCYGQSPGTFRASGIYLHSES